MPRYSGRSIATAIRRLTDLKLDPHNSNVGTERGRAALERSLRDYGAGRAVLVDRRGCVVAGNKTVEQAKRLNIPLRVVQTDGHHLVAVQRVDLDLATDPRAKALAIADNRVGELEDLFAPGLSACQGCNSELLIRHTLRHVGPETVLATPPGCIAGMGSVGYNGQTGTKVPVFHPLLTNTASMLTGIRRTYLRKGRDVTALALAGDGGVVDVGFQSLSGAAERGEQLLFICVDNEGYMNTGMQRSGSTAYGSWTSTTPVGEKMRGKTQDSKNMPLLMMMHRCEYVATASLGFMDDYYAKLDKAIAAAKRGMAYLHVHAPCPTGWRFASAVTIETCRRSVETNFVPLWEYSPDTGLHFTRSTDNPRPIEDYIKMFGKYRHLSKEQIEHIRHSVEDKVKTLKMHARGTEDFQEGVSS